MNDVTPTPDVEPIDVPPTPPEPLQTILLAVSTFSDVPTEEEGYQKLPGAPTKPTKVNEPDRDPLYQKLNPDGGTSLEVILNQIKQTLQNAIQNSPIGQITIFWGP
jgi:hypothetical protein